MSQLPDISSDNVLPSNHDLEALKDNITVLVCQTARRKYVDSKGVPQHIKHKYTAEMSLKSEVVSKYQHLYNDYVEQLVCSY